MVAFKAYEPSPEIVVELSCARWWIPAPPKIVGGSGSPGFIDLTYEAIDELLYSLSGSLGMDSYSNLIPVGYQGPISAQQPGSSPVVTESWHSLALTNATASGNCINGFYYRYKPENSVEVVFDIQVSASSGLLGHLPSGYAPVAQQDLVCGWYGTNRGSYTDTFAPYLKVYGKHDPTPGQIYLEGNPPVNLYLFGRTCITLDAT